MSLGEILSICAIAAFFLDVSETELKKAYRRLALFALMPRFIFRCVRDGAEESLPTHVSHGEIHFICAFAAFLFYRCFRDGAEESLPTHASHGENFLYLRRCRVLFLDVSETELKKAYRRLALFAIMPRVFFRCVRDGAEEGLPTPGSICDYAAFLFRCVRDGAEESLPTPGAGLPSGQEQGARGSRGIQGTGTSSVTPPGCLSRFPDLGSLISDPGSKNSSKREG